MREVSPAYLEHFMSAIDALSWVEQLHSGGATLGHTTAATAATRGKGTRGKPG